MPMYWKSMCACVLLLTLLPLESVADEDKFFDPTERTTTDFSFTYHAGVLAYERRTLRKTETYRNWSGEQFEIEIFEPNLKWQHEYVQVGATSRFGRFIDLDFRIGIATSDSDTEIFDDGSTNEVERELNYLLDAYARIYDHRRTEWRPFLVFGLRKQSANVFDDNGFMLGGGVEFALSREYWVNIEYKEMISGGQFQSNSLNFSLQYFYR
ncbi:MAG: hypothetical protein R3217_00725 [Gammaproteobacteria bacterium]|nr:hypothetical protein [Gammaproteobacteria bacterium]